jgi:hypothetical protein
MVLRIDMTSNLAYSMDDVIIHSTNPIPFNDVSDLDPPVPERVALLKLCEVGEQIDDVGLRLEKNVYLVQEL